MPSHSCIFWFRNCNFSSNVNIGNIGLINQIHCRTQYSQYLHFRIIAISKSENARMKGHLHNNEINSFLPPVILFLWSCSFIKYFVYSKHFLEFYIPNKLVRRWGFIKYTCICLFSFEEWQHKDLKTTKKKFYSICF